MIFQGYCTNAQQDTGFANETYLIFSTQPVFTNFKEEKISNLLYTGGGLSFSNTSEEYHKNWRFRIENFSVTFTYSQPYTKSSQAFNPRINLGGWAYKKLIDLPEKRLFAGPSIYGISNVKIVPELANSSVSVELIPFLQVGGWYEQDVKILKRDFVAFTRLDFPIYGYMWRLPKFGLSGFDALGSSHRPFWRFQRINWEFGVERKLPNLPNRWRLSYRWEFYHYKENEVFSTYTFYHYLGVSWLLRTK